MAEAADFRGPAAYVTGRYPARSMTFVDREIRAIRAAGCQVSTFTLRRSVADDIAGPFQTAEAGKVVALFAEALRPDAMLRAVASTLRSPRGFARALSLTVVTCPLNPGAILRQTAYLGAALVMARYLRRDGAVHIHNHLGDSSGTVAMLAAALTGLPFSITLHGPEIFDEARRWHLRRKIARAAVVACVSRDGLRRAASVARPADRGKLVLVRCGVEPERYGSRASGPGNRLLFIGRLEPRKGAAVLFDAFARLRGTNARLTIVGTGSEEPALRARIVRQGLGTSVRMVGPASEEEVARALTEADILVVPSLSEGLPVVIMEAMATGLPVIASAVDGIPELVVVGETGLLVQPGDPEALAGAIRRLMGDIDLRDRLSEAGRKRAIRDHDARLNACLLLDTIAACHARRGPSAPPAAASVLSRSATGDVR